MAAIVLRADELCGIGVPSEQLGGLRRPLEIILVGLGVSFVLAFMFEVFLKIVLPGGIFALNIPW